MKRILALVLTLLLTISLAACGGQDDNSSSGGSSAELKKITFCLDWTPNTNHTGLYVAAANGYYEEAGLDVEIVQPPEGGAALMCASGQAQFAIECQDTMAAGLVSDSPVEITAVAALLQHNTSGIISRKGEGMDTPKGLSGKTYATWDSPIEQAMIKYVVEKDGGDYSAINLIPNAITDEAAALKANQTDAIWIFYGWGGISAKLSGLEFDYFNFADIDSVFDYYTPVIVANNELLKNDPDTVKAFLEATKKGYEYAVSNPESAADILIAGDTTGALNDSRELVVESQKWISSQYKAEVEQWGYIDPARWNAFYAWLFDNGLIEKELPAGTGFTNDYLS